MRLNSGVSGGRKVVHHTLKVAVAAELHHSAQIHARLEQPGDACGAELVEPPDAGCMSQEDLERMLVLLSTLQPNFK